MVEKKEAKCLQTQLSTVAGGKIKIIYLIDCRQIRKIYNNGQKTFAFFNFDPSKFFQSTLTKSQI